MDKLYAIKSIAYPDGAVVHYKFGMPKPKPSIANINALIRAELLKPKNLKRI